MNTIGIIREFNTKNFTVTVDALTDNDIDLSFAEDADEIIEQLESGELTAFCVRASVYMHGIELGSDYLGGCLYKSIDEFQDHIESGKYKREQEKKHGKKINVGSYFVDVVRQAISEARLRMKELNGIKLRTI